jgi:hypothetical protein
LFDEKALILLPTSKLGVILKRFQKEADTSFIEAKRSMTTSTTQIPMWFIVLTLLLGWNEILMVLKSPLFFLTLAIVGGGIIFSYIFKR